MAGRARFAFLEGEVRPWEDAHVHVSTVGFKFGTGVFEGIRGYWNPDREQMYLFRLGEHLERLVRSQRFMRFGSVFEPDYVGEKIIELIRANELRETVHIMATSCSASSMSLMPSIKFCLGGNQRPATPRVG